MYYIYTYIYIYIVVWYCCVIVSDLTLNNTLMTISFQLLERIASYIKSV